MFPMLVTPPAMAALEPAGKHERAGRIDLPPAAQGAAELADPAAGDPHVALGRAARCDHGAAADDQVALEVCDRCPPPSGPSAGRRGLQGTTITGQWACRASQPGTEPAT